MRFVRRSSRSFRQHLTWALLDVGLDLSLLGLTAAWALTHLRPHG